MYNNYICRWPKSDENLLNLGWTIFMLLWILNSNWWKIFVSTFFFQVVKYRPNDKDAKLKFTECSKIVKRQAFERAIRSDDTKTSVVDSLDIENMSKSLKSRLVIETEDLETHCHEIRNWARSILMSGSLHLKTSRLWYGRLSYVIWALLQIINDSGQVWQWSVCHG